MFVVKQVRRGFFRDKVWVTATADASQTRRKLGWDSLQAPDLKEESMQIRQGDEFNIALKRNSVEVGQLIGPDQVATWSAFRKLWRRAG